MTDNPTLSDGVEVTQDQCENGSHCCCNTGTCCDCGASIPIIHFQPEEVESLNDFQMSGVMHPFTCGKSHPEPRTLLATTRGWVCPVCDYTQDWAHDFMKDGSWRAHRHRLSTRDDGLPFLNSLLNELEIVTDCLSNITAVTGQDSDWLGQAENALSRIEALLSPQPEQSAPAGDGEGLAYRSAMASLEAQAKVNAPTFYLTNECGNAILAALRTQSQPVLTDEVVEQRYIDRFTGRPIGDHGTAHSAIRFAMECEHDLANRDAFLRAWTDGDLTEWPEYYGWLENVEPVAALASMGEGE